MKTHLLERSSITTRSSPLATNTYGLRLMGPLSLNGVVCDGEPPRRIPVWTSRNGSYSLSDLKDLTVHGQE